MRRRSLLALPYHQVSAIAHQQVLPFASLPQRQDLGRARSYAPREEFSRSALGNVQAEWCLTCVLRQLTCWTKLREHNTDLVRGRCRNSDNVEVDARDIGAIDDRDTRLARAV